MDRIFKFTREMAECTDELLGELYKDKNVLFFDLLDGSNILQLVERGLNRGPVYIKVKGSIDDKDFIKAYGEYNEKLNSHARQTKVLAGWEGDDFIRGWYTLCMEYEEIGNCSLIQWENLFRVYDEYEYLRIYNHNT